MCSLLLPLESRQRRSRCGRVDAPTFIPGLFLGKERSSSCLTENAMFFAPDASPTCLVYISHADPSSRNSSRHSLNAGLSVRRGPHPPLLPTRRRVVSVPSHAHAQEYRAPALDYGLPTTFAVPHRLLNTLGSTLLAMDADRPEPLGRPCHS
ncbi:hypothetical protein OE88DRAFT_918258 [Heliocybe sulcata]|uniref:Uncharacterized protein n=1 Tax=Heliocybe sulcata TaxID=5364 RepID=A0A5C3MMA0_9AGAM|nr:hypothetical protein OE88DRAFT_918258 [Heliocybe sulcata]